MQCRKTLISALLVLLIIENAQGYGNEEIYWKVFSYLVSALPDMTVDDYLKMEKTYHIPSDEAKLYRKFITEVFMEEISRVLTAPLESEKQRLALVTTQKPSIHDILKEISEMRAARLATLKPASNSGSATLENVKPPRTPYRPRVRRRLKKIPTAIPADIDEAQDSVSLNQDVFQDNDKTHHGAEIDYHEAEAPRELDENLPSESEQKNAEQKSASGATESNEPNDTNELILEETPSKSDGAEVDYQKAEAPSELDDNLPSQSEQKIPEPRSASGAVENSEPIDTNGLIMEETPTKPDENDGQYKQHFYIKTEFSKKDGSAYRQMGLIRVPISDKIDIQKDIDSISNGSLKTTGTENNNIESKADDPTAIPSPAPPLFSSTENFNEVFSNMQTNKSLFGNKEINLSSGTNISVSRNKNTRERFVPVEKSINRFSDIDIHDENKMKLERNNDTINGGLVVENPFKNDMKNGTKTTNQASQNITKTGVSDDGPKITPRSLGSTNVDDALNVDILPSHIDTPSSNERIDETEGKQLNDHSLQEILDPQWEAVMEEPQVKVSDESGDNNKTFADRDIRKSLPTIVPESETKSRANSVGHPLGKRSKFSSLPSDDISISDDDINYKTQKFPPPIEALYQKMEPYRRHKVKDGSQEQLNLYGFDDPGDVPEDLPSERVIKNDDDDIKNEDEDISSEEELVPHKSKHMVGKVLKRHNITDPAVLRDLIKAFSGHEKEPKQTKKARGYSRGRPKINNEDFKDRTLLNRNSPSSAYDKNFHKMKDNPDISDSSIHPTYHEAFSIHDENTTPDNKDYPIEEETVPNKESEEKNHPNAPAKSKTFPEHTPLYNKPMNSDGGIDYDGDVPISTKSLERSSTTEAISSTPSTVEQLDKERQLERGKAVSSMRNKGRYQQKELHYPKEIEHEDTDDIKPLEPPSSSKPSEDEGDVHNGHKVFGESDIHPAEEHQSNDDTKPLEPPSSSKPSEDEVDVLYGHKVFGESYIHPGEEHQSNEDTKPLEPHSSSKPSEDEGDVLNGHKVFEQSYIHPADEDKSLNVPDVSQVSNRDAEGISNFESTISSTPEPYDGNDFEAERHSQKDNHDANEQIDQQTDPMEGISLTPSVMYDDDGAGEDELPEDNPENNEKMSKSDTKESKPDRLPSVHQTKRKPTLNYNRDADIEDRGTMSKMDADGYPMPRSMSSKKDHINKSHGVLLRKSTTSSLGPGSQNNDTDNKVQLFEQLPVPVLQGNDRTEGERHITLEQTVDRNSLSRDKSTHKRINGSNPSSLLPTDMSFNLTKYSPLHNGSTETQKSFVSEKGYRNLLPSSGEINKDGFKIFPSLFLGNTTNQNGTQTERKEFKDAMLAAVTTVPIKYSSENFLGNENETSLLNDKKFSPEIVPNRTDLFKKHNLITSAKETGPRKHSTESHLFSPTDAGSADYKNVLPESKLRNNYDMQDTQPKKVQTMSGPTAKTPERIADNLSQPQSFPKANVVEMQNPVFTEFKALKDQTTPTSSDETIPSSALENIGLPSNKAHAEHEDLGNLSGTNISETHKNGDVKKASVPPTKDVYNVDKANDNNTVLENDYKPETRSFNDSGYQPSYSNDTDYDIEGISEEEIMDYILKYGDLYDLNLIQNETELIPPPTPVPNIAERFGLITTTGNETDGTLPLRSDSNEEVPGLLSNLGIDLKPLNEMIRKSKTNGGSKPMSWRSVDFETNSSASRRGYRMNPKELKVYGYGTKSNSSIHDTWTNLKNVIKKNPKYKKQEIGHKPKSGDTSKSNVPIIQARSETGSDKPVLIPQTTQAYISGLNAQNFSSPTGREKIGPTVNLPQLQTEPTVQNRNEHPQKNPLQTSIHVDTFIHNPVNSVLDKKEDKTSVNTGKAPSSSANTTSYVYNETIPFTGKIHSLRNSTEQIKDISPSKDNLKLTSGTPGYSEVTENHVFKGGENIEKAQSKNRENLQVEASKIKNINLHFPIISEHSDVSGKENTQGLDSNVQDTTHSQLNERTGSNRKFGTALPALREPSTVWTKDIVDAGHGATLTNDRENRRDQTIEINKYGFPLPVAEHSTVLGAEKSKQGETVLKPQTNDLSIAKSVKGEAHISISDLSRIEARSFSSRTENDEVLRSANKSHEQNQSISGNAKADYNKRTFSDADIPPRFTNSDAGNNKAIGSFLVAPKNTDVVNHVFRAPTIQAVPTKYENPKLVEVIVDGQTKSNNLLGLKNKTNGQSYELFDTFPIKSLESPNVPSDINMTNQFKTRENVMPLSRANTNGTYASKNMAESVVDPKPILNKTSSYVKSDLRHSNLTQFSKGIITEKDNFTMKKLEPTPILKKEPTTYAATTTLNNAVANVSMPFHNLPKTKESYSPQVASDGPARSKGSSELPLGYNNAQEHVNFPEHYERDRYYNAHDTTSSSKLGSNTDLRNKNFVVPSKEMDISSNNKNGYPIIPTINSNYKLTQEAANNADINRGTEYVNGDLWNKPSQYFDQIVPEKLLPEITSDLETTMPHSQLDYGTKYNSQDNNNDSIMKGKLNPTIVPHSDEKLRFEDFHHQPIGNAASVTPASVQKDKYSKINKESNPKEIKASIEEGGVNADHEVDSNDRFRNSGLGESLLGHEGFENRDYPAKNQYAPTMNSEVTNRGKGFEYDTSGSTKMHNDNVKPNYERDLQSYRKGENVSDIKSGKRTKSNFDGSETISPVKFNYESPENHLPLETLVFIPKVLGPNDEAVSKYNNPRGLSERDKSLPQELASELKAGTQRPETNVNFSNGNNFFEGKMDEPSRQQTADAYPVEISPKNNIEAFDPIRKSFGQNNGLLGGNLPNKTNYDVNRNDATRLVSTPLNTYKYAPKNLKDYIDRSMNNFQPGGRVIDVEKPESTSLDNERNFAMNPTPPTRQPSVEPISMISRTNEPNPKDNKRSDRPVATQNSQPRIETTDASLVVKNSGFQPGQFQQHMVRSAIGSQIDSSEFEAPLSSTELPRTRRIKRGGRAITNHHSHMYYSKMEGPFSSTELARTRRTKRDDHAIRRHRNWKNSLKRRHEKSNHAKQKRHNKAKHKSRYERKHKLL